MLFEKHCEKREDIDWVYKNGDSGQQYFSIVYIDAMQHQWLFYADYIVKKKDGTVWIIETKGGESRGKDKISIFKLKTNSMPLSCTLLNIICIGALSAIRIMICILTIQNFLKIWQTNTGCRWKRCFNEKDVNYELYNGRETIYKEFQSFF